MTYRGLPNWPPVWTWRGGGAGDKRARGEVGILRDAFLSRIEPKSRLFLIIEHENEEYMGCLLFSDTSFCGQIYELLKDSCGWHITDIGSTNVAHQV